MSIFGPSMEQISCDPCINEVIKFVKTVNLIEQEYESTKRITISIGQKITCEYFQFDYLTGVCGFQNAFLRGQIDEDYADRKIGEIINADDLPKGTGIQFHYDNHNECDYYAMQYSCTPQYNNVNKYADVLVDSLKRNGIPIISVSKKSLKNKSFSITIK